MSDNNKEAYWIGFDLGGTKMLATVFDSRFKALGRERKKTKGYEGVKAGFERIAITIHKALDEAKVSKDQISGIGIGCPGVLDLDRGVILESANLSWHDAKLKDFLEDEFKCPAVICNDVDSGVYGEYRFGAAKGARCVLGVFPGTGIGGGCVYEGKIFRGKKNSCLEIGHIQVTRDGQLCGCGRRGCLETEASRLAISAAAAQAAFRGEAPYLLSVAGTDLGEIRSGILADSIKNGDATIEKIIHHAAEMIGVAIGGIVNLLAPDVIVLGGGLVEAMPRLFVDTVDETARAHCMPSFSRVFKTVPAKLGDEANAMGAAAWAEAAIPALTASTT
jgi:glucokinase